MCDGNQHKNYVVAMVEPQTLYRSIGAETNIEVELEVSYPHDLSCLDRRHAVFS